MLSAASLYSPDGSWPCWSHGAVCARSWCGPCRTLAPVLQRAVEAHDGKVLLAKVGFLHPLLSSMDLLGRKDTCTPTTNPSLATIQVNVDNVQEVANELMVSSIPAVFAFWKRESVNRFVNPTHMMDVVPDPFFCLLQIYWELASRASGAVCEGRDRHQLQEGVMASKAETESGP